MALLPNRNYVDDPWLVAPKRTYGDVGRIGYAPTPPSVPNV